MLLFRVITTSNLTINSTIAASNVHYATNAGTNTNAYTVALNKRRINDVNTEIPFIFSSAA